jgi:hypothetical protein
MKMAVFWVVAPCSLVEVYQRFRGPCCLHYQGDESLIHISTVSAPELIPSLIETIYTDGQEHTN